MSKEGAIKKMKSLRFQIAMDELTAALAKMQRIAGQENFNFVGLMTVYDNFPEDIKKENLKSDTELFFIGDEDTNMFAMEACLEHLYENDEEGKEETPVIPIGFGNNPKAEA